MAKLKLSSAGRGAGEPPRLDPDFPPSAYQCLGQLEEVAVLERLSTKDLVEAASQPHPPASVRSAVAMGAHLTEVATDPAIPLPLVKAFRRLHRRRIELRGMWRGTSSTATACPKA